MVSIKRSGDKLILRDTMKNSSYVLDDLKLIELTDGLIDEYVISDRQAKGHEIKVDTRREFQDD